MKEPRKIMLVSILVLALTSCSAFAPKPTETPVPTATNLPTLTFTPEPTIPPTPTKKPTQTPVPPTETPAKLVLPMPTGKPAKDWEGIPVMPGAIAGNGDSKGYSFTIKATPDEIQKYYEKEMAKMGWNMFATGQGANDTILLIFMKDSGTASVSIFPQPDGLMYVMLVK